MLKWTIINDEWVKRPPPPQDLTYIMAYDVVDGDRGTGVIASQNEFGVIEILEFIDIDRVEKKESEK